jgi:hypothetical protein
MVWSRPHHLRHQWPQISTFASLNHIHHHTYFKSPYVHIQVFHILPHHKMKLLQALKSFMPGESIVENRQRNRFAASHPIRQRKLFRCRPHNSTVKKNCFNAGNRTSAANTDSLQTTHIQQRTRVRCGQHNFASKYYLAADNTISTTNTSSPLTTQFQQRALIRCRQHTFDSEH